MNSKETQKEKTKESSFLSLPNEITEDCLARISKWKYPNLSLVSKKFLSILSSPELYATRSHIGTTEPCLYFCFKQFEYTPPNWYTLWMKPAYETLDDDEIIDETLDDEFDFGCDYSLVPVPSSHPRREPYLSMVGVGSEIYVIGRPYGVPPSSTVRILDCRNHTWRDGPSMLVARADAFAVYLDEKIYVMGGCGKDDIWMEVFDIKTRAWRPLPSPGDAKFRDNWYMTNVLDGRIYSIGQMEDYAYDPREGTWEVVETHSSYNHIDIWCVIENVRYCFTNSGFCMWYDSTSKEWKDVKGLEFLRTHRTCGLAWGCVAELLNYGGKLLVVWVPKYEQYNRKPKRRVWCATILLEKRHGNEVWGKVDWANTVYTFRKPYYFLSCVAISI